VNKATATPTFCASFKPYCTNSARESLLRWGGQINHDVAEVMRVVQPETYRKRVRQSKRGIVFKRAGRPCAPMAMVNLVLRMAEEIPRWAYRRIIGEFKKLGIRIGSSTVKKILDHLCPNHGLQNAILNK